MNLIEAQAIVNARKIPWPEGEFGSFELRWAMLTVSLHKDLLARAGDNGKVRELVEDRYARSVAILLAAKLIE